MIMMHMFIYGHGDCDGDGGDDDKTGHIFLL